MSSQNLFAQSVNRAEQIAPLLDESTVAVVRFDLQKVVDVYESNSEEDFTYDDVNVVHPKKSLPFFKTLLSEGVQELYVPVSPSLQSCLIMLLENEEQARSFHSRFSENRTFKRAYQKILLHGSCVIAVPRGLKENFIPDVLVERSGLKPGLEAVKDYPVQIVFALTPEQEHLFAEILEGDIKDLEIFAGKNLNDMFHAISIGLPLASNTAEIVVTSRSADAAADFSEALPAYLKYHQDQIEKLPIIKRSHLLQWIQLKSAPVASGVTSRFQVEQVLTEDTDDSLDFAAWVIARFIEPPAENDVPSLRFLALAMHRFHEAYKSFPPSASYDGDKPLLSWRVHLLPFLDQEELYKKFRLDEPWDSEHNRQLITQMPELYLTEHQDLNDAGKTCIVVPVDEKTLFHGKAGRSIREVIDGTSSTIMILDAPREFATEWTRPSDLEINWDELKDQLFGGRESFKIILADGRVKQIPSSINAETLRRLLMHQDREIVGDY